MLNVQLQDSVERQFLLDTPLQYIVQLMKRRDYEFHTVMQFPKVEASPAVRRRVAGVKTPSDWSPNYAKPVKIQTRSYAISASETQRRIYAAGANPTDFWSNLKRVNGKDFQLFWCIEDYVNQDYKPLDAHAAIIIAGLHTKKLNAKYSTDATLRARFGDDYGIRDIIAQCVRAADLAVKHTTVERALAGDKYSSQIHSVFELRARGTRLGRRSADETKIAYLTKSVNDPSGSMCFGGNRKLEPKFHTFLQSLTNDFSRIPHHE